MSEDPKKSPELKPEGQKAPQISLEPHQTEIAEELSQSIPQEQRQDQQTNIAKELADEAPYQQEELFENITPHPGEIQKKLIDLTEKTKKSREADINKLKQATIEDIRYRADFLSQKTSGTPQEKINNLKEETARRVLAYANNSTIKDQWITLDYAKMGADPDGRSHEYFIGLGDILIDPDIKEVLIKKGTMIIHAFRGLVKEGPHKGRIGFITKTGRYVATFTGDQFMILSSNSISTTEYRENFETEEKSRKEHLEEHQKENVKKPHTEKTETIKNNHGISDEWIIKKLNNRLQNKEGEAILNYAKGTCAQFGIPFNIFKELIKIESGWNPGVEYKGKIASDATGLGQFLGGTWRSFMKYCEKNNIHDPKWGSKPLTQEHRKNPYANIYATAWLMSQTKKSLGTRLNNEPLSQQGITYYMAHHEGLGGVRPYLKFITEMQNDGHKTANEMINAYQKSPEKYNAFLIRSQINRIKKYGINGFIKLYHKIEKTFSIFKESYQQTVETPTTGVKEKFEIKMGKYELSSAINVKSNQDRWILGSSGAVHLSSYLKANSGACGIAGAGSGNFLKMFKEHIWPKINHLKLPKEIILVGMAVNTVGYKSAESILADYNEIANFFETKGVKVKFATVQIARPKGKKWNEEKREKFAQKLINFNEALRKKYPDKLIDVAKYTSSPDGKSISSRFSGGDGVHLNKKGKEAYAAIIENRYNSG